MLQLVQYFQNITGNAQPAFDRLPGIGVGADGQWLADVARLPEFLPEQPGGFRLVVELGFEVEPRRMPEIGVAGSGIAIDAAMLAAAIGVQ